MSIAGQRVLVSGASSGLGRAIAVRLSEAGATVGIIGRDADRLAATAKAIAEVGRSGPVGIADVRDRGGLGATIDRLGRELGGLDGAVNAAGVFGSAAPVGELDPVAWDEVLAVNLTGVFDAMQHQIRQLRGSGGGWIVNVSSNIGAHRRLASLAGYVASKAAVSALTRVAALDHIGEGIRINAVSPGAADTTMSIRPGETRDQRDARMRSQNPTGRVARLDEVVDAVIYLATATYCVGTDLVVDGGTAA